MNHPTPYTAEPLSDSDGINDIRIHIDGKVWHLWGRNGLARELDLAATVPYDTLPVLIGSGLGHCLRTLLERGLTVAVVDKEQDIEALTELRQEFADNPKVLWLDDATPQESLNTLTKWQADNQGKPFHPTALPLYIRLDRPYYGTLADTLKANAKADFWSQARYPKFESVTPRILFVDSHYFLCGEILTSLKRLDIEHQTIELDKSGVGSQDFIETLLRHVVDFKPDFVLTVNHFGLDREGKLAELLADLKLPLASWFVDNPHLILHQYDHPGSDNTAIFTYDAGNLDQMRARGFTNTHYLPLATDPSRFAPNKNATGLAEWTSDVSFVGNSMTEAVSNSLHNTVLPETLDQPYNEIAADFGSSGTPSVAEFLKEQHPDWYAALQTLPTLENRLALESLITWEATRQYRLRCVQQILKFSPLIVGDSGWNDQIDPMSGWRHLPSLDYYEDLPRFYPMSKINFNCTSRQMIGAVNQRVFDVPACGGFVLTDHREQMEDLFDLESEVAIYRDPEEIPGLVRRYLKDDHHRKMISENARKRILAEHTYEIRLSKLISIMRKTFTA